MLGLCNVQLDLKVDLDSMFNFMLCWFKPQIEQYSP